MFLQSFCTGKSHLWLQAHLLDTMHLDVMPAKPSCGPSFPARTHNWDGEQRAIVGYKTNSPRDSLQRFSTVGAGHIPLSCTDAWKGGWNFHGNRLHSADSGGLSLSGYVCHPWCSEFQGQQCVMDTDWSGVVLGSDILAKGMYCKCTWVEALWSDGDTGTSSGLAQTSATPGSC